MIGNCFPETAFLTNGVINSMELLQESINGPRIHGRTFEKKGNLRETDIPSPRDK